MFSNLLKLYRSSNALKTPLEDFCTESLAGVLKSDKKLLQAFSTDLLKLPSNETFSLSTQKSFKSENSKRIYVDMVFESASTICFLEMKVNSQEGHNQLESYNTQLLELKNDTKKSIKLCYCTLHRDVKDEFSDSDIFSQFRWVDIAKLLKTKTEKNNLVKEFYSFLEEYRMAGNDRFTYEDILGLLVYKDIASKASEIFENLEEEIVNKFSKLSQKDKFNQITSFNRLAVWSENILGNGYSEILIGIEFSGSPVNNGPRLVSQIWIAGGNSENKGDKFSEECRKNNLPVKEIESGYGVQFFEPLSKFIDSDNQLKEIENWYRQKIKRFHDFKENSNLVWK